MSLSYVYPQNPNEGLSKLTGGYARIGTAHDALAEIQAGTDLTHYSFAQLHANSQDHYNEFASFYRFLSSITDPVVKEELIELAFPVFAFVYFRLAGQNIADRAGYKYFASQKSVCCRTFFSQFSPLFQRSHSEELVSIFSCRTREIARVCPIYDKVRNGFHIRISLTSLGVGLGFLYENSYKAILTIIFKRIRISVLSSLPSRPDSVKRNAIRYHGAKEVSTSVPKDLAPLSVAAMTFYNSDFDGLNAPSSGKVDVKVKRKRKGRKPKPKVNTDEDGEDRLQDQEDGEGEEKGEGDDEDGDDDDEGEEGEGEGEEGEGEEGEGEGNEDEREEEAGVMVDHSLMFDDDYDDQDDDTIPLYDGSEGSMRKVAYFSPAFRKTIDQQRRLARAFPLGVRANTGKTQLPSIILTTAHDQSDSVSCMAIAPSATVLAAGRTCSSIRVWKLDEAKNMRKMFAPETKNLFVGHSRSVTSLSFSLDANYLLSSSVDSTVRLWCVPANCALTTYAANEPKDPVWNTKFNNIGSFFVTCSADKIARLFTTDFVHPVRMFVGHTSDVLTSTFHPNCAYVATGSLDKTVRLWDIGTGGCIRLFPGMKAGVSCVAISPDGSTLAAGSLRGDIHIWDINSGHKRRVLEGHHGAPVYTMSFSSDGNILASGGADQAVRLWDTNYVSLGKDLKNCEEEACLGVFQARQTPIHAVQFSYTNYLMAAGPFQESQPQFPL